MKYFFFILPLFFFSCKPTQDNTVDEKPYYRLSDANNGVKSRAEDCAKEPNKKFYVQTEECLTPDEAQANCLAQKFYIWNATKETCEFSQQRVEEYNLTHCAPKGMILRNGVCTTL